MSIIDNKNLNKKAKNLGLSNKKNWEKQNKEAIEEYNQRVKYQGLFSDSFRNF